MACELVIRWASPHLTRVEIVDSAVSLVPRGGLWKIVSPGSERTVPQCEFKTLRGEIR